MASSSEQFPRFIVPGEERRMDALRDLYLLHYPGSGPQSTMWDEWLPSAALWPATGDQRETFRAAWANALSGRILDTDGYVATHQHGSIAHPLGWPFPFWNQGAGGCGWHFSFKDTVGLPWRQDHLDKPEGWTLGNAVAVGMEDAGWAIETTDSGASVTPPQQPIDTFQAPFVQLRWTAHGLGRAQPCLEWATKDRPAFGPDRRMYFPTTEGDVIAHAALPMYRHPLWTGEVTRLRVLFGDAPAGAKVTIQALFTQYDTRHNTNSQSFINGCAAYFNWTRDLPFLRANIQRMRQALRYDLTEFHALDRNVIVTDWVGHDGRTGLLVKRDGSKEILPGHGVGNNYWDLLPFGNEDAYATIHHYAAAVRMAAIERDIRNHPEWNVPLGPLSFEPDMLVKHAAAVKAVGNKRFWNPRTGRFVACVDADGKAHDYGYTFVNCEAIAYGFATSSHAREVMRWLNGERSVRGDTSRGADIYRFRFGPRSSTLRNVGWYGWFWNGPESIPWGGQVQDGGAVLGFSYHDVMARLAVLGPDNAWKRLLQIADWFSEVQQAGGYREYYKDKPDVSLQGGGTAGGLGLDHEFHESVLLPQVMLDGFLGFIPTGDGFRLNPRLPRDWPSLSVEGIDWHGLTLRVKATPKVVDVWKEGTLDEPVFVCLPAGPWKMTYLAPNGLEEAATVVRRKPDNAIQVDWQHHAGVRFER
jgi:hypothetical protein